MRKSNKSRLSLKFSLGKWLLLRAYFILTNERVRSPGGQRLFPSHCLYPVHNSPRGDSSKWLWTSHLKLKNGDAFEILRVLPSSVRICAVQRDDPEAKLSKMNMNRK